jgi:hypothetical protein
MPNQKDPNDVGEFVRDLMFEIMAVLWAHGYTEIPAGALMRLLGVDREHALKHDEEYIILDDNFAEAVSTLQKTPRLDATIPPDVTIH